MFAGFFSLSISLLCDVEPESGLAAGLIRPVAFEAAVREDGPDITIELKGLKRGNGARTKQGKDRKKNCG